MSTTIIVTTDPDEATALIGRLVRPAPAPAIAAAQPLPAIPQAEPAEIYAGIAFDERGKPSHHLFLLAAKDDKRRAWKDAVEWAEGLGASLPTRFESALLYANLRDQFNTSGWYWTNTQFSASNAWGQSFHNGGQTSSDKSYEGRVRAVRRLPI